MEELTIVIGIIGSLFVGLLGVYLFTKRTNPVKKAQKRNEMSLFDNLTDYREVEKSTIADILKQKDNQIKSLNARLKQFEPETEVIDENIKNNKKSVSFEEITALVNQSYPKYAPLLPLMKKQIMEMTKGMTLDEILNYVRQITGNKEPAAIVEPKAATYDPNWA